MSIRVQGSDVECVARRDVGKMWDRFLRALLRALATAVV